MSLRARRQERGLTLQDVADRVGIDVGHLSRVERGQSGISVAVLARVCRVVGMDAEAKLLEGFSGYIPKGDGDVLDTNVSGSS